MTASTNLMPETAFSTVFIFTYLALSNVFLLLLVSPSYTRRHGDTGTIKSLPHITVLSLIFLLSESQAVSEKPQQKNSSAQFYRKNFTPTKMWEI